ncbi:MAG TPA: hypothetical protein VKV74_04570 [Bryobacteraceae bacterium]|nr:hypothetical protein [Bryobacteraceae bacterium]
MRLLKLALIPLLASGLVFAQRGGGGRGGGGFGGGFRGGGGMMMGGGGLRGGGGFGGGGFRGGFAGGGFRGGFVNRGFFNRGFGSTVFIGGWPWWGWGWPSWGWGGWPIYVGGYPGCDPYWGCPGGYVDPGYASVAGYPQQQPPVTYAQPPAPPVVINQSFGATDAALGQPGQVSASFYRTPDYYLIAFNDHTIRAAVNYSVAADTIIWTTREGQTMKAPLSSVDVRFSQQINRDRRVDFRLP